MQNLMLLPEVGIGEASTVKLRMMSEECPAWAMLNFKNNRMKTINQYNYPEPKFIVAQERKN